MKIKWKETIAVNIINFITSDKYLIKFIRSQNDKKKKRPTMVKECEKFISTKFNTQKKYTHTHEIHIYFLFFRCQFG